MCSMIMGQVLNEFYCEESNEKKIYKNFWDEETNCVV